MELEVVLDILQNNYPKFWEDLWNIQTPFLDSGFICTVETTSQYIGLHGLLHKLGLTLNNVLGTYR